LWEKGLRDSDVVQRNRCDAVMSESGQQQALPRRTIGVRFSSDFVAKVLLHSSSKFLLAVHAIFL
jgi:hypothetical protein